MNLVCILDGPSSCHAGKIRVSSWQAYEHAIFICLANDPSLNPIGANSHLVFRVTEELNDSALIGSKAHNLTDSTN